MSNRSYRTPKGTELPIILLKGKEYLEVKYRVVWFREERPSWRIETEYISITETSAFAKATIKDESGNVIATSHKFEDKAGFFDFAEKAETGSIGRALALCGFGTSFCADELDEGKRIVDAPNEPKNEAPKSDDPKDWPWPFPYPPGMKGVALKDLGTDGLLKAGKSLADWQAKAEKGVGAQFPADGKRFMDAMRDMLKAQSNGAQR